MSLDVVSFRLRQRCLEVMWNGQPFTPVFQLPGDDISISGDKVALPYITLSFGRQYGVQGPLVPAQVKGGISGNCPQQALLISGLTRSEDMPKPATPPTPKVQ